MKRAVFSIDWRLVDGSSNRSSYRSNMTNYSFVELLFQYLGLGILCAARRKAWDEEQIFNIY